MTRENRRANDIDGSALAAQPGKSQGRPLNARAPTRPSSKTACPACVLPRAPRPGQPNVDRPPDITGAFGRAVTCPDERRAVRRIRALPLALEYCFTRRASAAETDRIERRLRHVCKPFGTDVERAGEFIELRPGPQPKCGAWR